MTKVHLQSSYCCTCGRPLGAAAFEASLGEACSPRCVAAAARRAEAEGGAGEEIPVYPPAVPEEPDAPLDAGLAAFYGGERPPPPDLLLAHARGEGEEEPALARQVGGNHYKALAIQPVEYIHANGLGFIEGSVVKYVTRWRERGGFTDLEKARHFLDLLLQLEGRVQ
jgi:Protein of unknwon function (DUF3310)